MRIFKKKTYLEKKNKVRDGAQKMIIIVSCPHCHGMVLIEQLNCKIFRHGVFEGTYQQIPPHASEQECTTWFKTKQIVGCGKPFKLQLNNNNNNQEKWEAVVCDYV